MFVSKVNIKIILLISIFFTSNLFAQSKLKILNWSEYIDINILKSYVAKTDTQIQYIIYENNEELIKLLNSGETYDIIFPSSNYIAKLKSDKSISKIDYSKIANYKDIDPYFKNKENIKDYALPYFWGTTSIVYNSKHIKLKSFKDLWKTDLKDKLFILDDMRDMFAISLLALNFDINTKDEKQIKEAYEKLLELIPNIKGFYSDVDTLDRDFSNNNCFASITYNGDVIKLVNNKNIKFLYPKEGAILWIDTIAIGKKSQNKEKTYDFINYLISKEVSNQNADKMGYAPPLKDHKLDMSIYPNKIDQNKLKSVSYLDDTEDTYQKYWDMFLKELSKKGITNEE